MERSSATLSKSLLESLCHHVGLPDRLPNGKENNLEEIENKLADLALQACFDLSDSTEGDRAQSIWEKIATSIHTARLLNEGGKLESRSLLRAFRELDHDQALILHVVEQNAGLIIRHIQSESETLVLFESFEVSALSENVLAATGGLQREFPGCSVAIPSTIFSDASFQSELALFLSKASHESIKRFAAKTRKAGSLAYESRDTVHPALITEMLMSLLQANGRLLPTPVTQKIVHDDVCWDNREQPWRRSPFWLVLRVGIQRQLCELSDWEEGRVCYKFMMCEVIANLIDKAVQILEPDLLSALQHKLGRRLTKLEVDKKSADVRVREVYAQLFARRGDAYESIINNVTLQIEGVWSNFKTRTKRSIPSLEQYRNSAHGSKDVKLPLLNCYPYITQILEEAKTRKAINYQHSSFVFNASSTVAQKAREFAQRCFKLAEMEAKIKKECEPQHMGRDSTDEQKCNARARAFREYVKHVRDFYDGNSEQKGVMLLLVMEMWILLDKAAINLYSLLKKHHCAEFCDMTIFAEPVSGCFAEQYYDQHSPGEMQVLHEKILVAAKRAEDIKKQEWQSKSDEYEKYVKEMEVTPCAYDSDKSLDEDEHQSQASQKQILLTLYLKIIRH
ncbi:hypothetical protein M7I_4030 [Glarea lozoyensis 74030]|uniref:DUF6606 domain-containing protein n=1 Tax=Glarea lozoyensis (strain ATCC 74030 / MF5533) TaxID=1104152 RepID=H0EN29_GLAL7|nr:hypothetical protein M7I_4030 [Glarea lozoyensis 74030]